VDVNAWVGVQRGQGSLAEMRRLWEDHLQKIKSGVSAAELTEFKKHPVNLAGGGLRMSLPSPVELAERVLVYLSIGDKQGIICALAETIWASQAREDGTQQIGLRFLNILEEDQARIDAVVKMLIDRLGTPGET
jgi:c-di-GMP-binding flagellar brake protein YcgR